MIGTTVIAPRLDLSQHAPGGPDKAEPVEQGLDTPVISSSQAPATGERPSFPPVSPDRPVIHWRMASAYPGALPQLGTLAKRIGQKIWEVSEGGMEIEFFEPGTLVPPKEMFDAVASGTIEAAFSSPGFWAAKAPALQIFSSVPFGPDPGEYLAWIYFGGGLELYDEIYQKYGIHSIMCGMIAPEASGWFRRKFTTLDDFKGLRIRATGLGARVYNKLGVKTLPLEESEIYMALESGKIDAAEFSMPAIDLKLGFYALAGHYYFPGWHQPATLFDLMINKDKWDALPRTKKAQIEAVCGDNIRYGLAEGEALQYGALKELTAKGVKIHRWPSPFMEAFRSAWADVASEQSGADATFRRAWNSLGEFRKNYSTWDELARP
ncbi:MAG: TRAP transporter substrate-binding protein [Rhodospirillales bacterium]|nr:TRAP transporter substrate-binding protein [Rhodospirillales bacterium]